MADTFCVVPGGSGTALGAGGCDAGATVIPPWPLSYAVNGGGWLPVMRCHSALQSATGSPVTAGMTASAPAISHCTATVSVAPELLIAQPMAALAATAVTPTLATTGSRCRSRRGRVVSSVGSVATMRASRSAPASALALAANWPSLIRDSSASRSSNLVSLIAFPPQPGSAVRAPVALLIVRPQRRVSRPSRQPEQTRAADGRGATATG